MATRTVVAAGGDATLAATYVENLPVTAADDVVSSGMTAGSVFTIPDGATFECLSYTGTQGANVANNARMLVGVGSTFRCFGNFWHYNTYTDLSGNAVVEVDGTAGAASIRNGWVDERGGGFRSLAAGIWERGVVRAVGTIANVTFNTGLWEGAWPGIGHMVFEDIGGSVEYRMFSGCSLLMGGTVEFLRCGSPYCNGVSSNAGTQVDETSVVDLNFIITDSIDATYGGFRMDGTSSDGYAGAVSDNLDLDLVVRGAAAGRPQLRYMDGWRMFRMNFDREPLFVGGTGLNSKNWQLLQDYFSGGMEIGNVSTTLHGPVYTANVVSQGANPHGFTYTGLLDNVAITDVWVQSGYLTQGGEAGDAHIGGTGGAHRATLRQCGMCQSPGAVAMVFATTNHNNASTFNFDIEHCVGVIDDTLGRPVLRTGEVANDSVGTISSFRSNAFYFVNSHALNTLHSDIATGGVSDVGVVSQANYNWTNANIGTSRYHATTEAGSGANDPADDLAFFDHTCNIESWDFSLGGPGTIANAVTEICKRKSIGYNAAYNVGALNEYLATCIRSTVIIPGHDANRIGTYFYTFPAAGGAIISLLHAGSLMTDRYLGHFGVAQVFEKIVYDAAGAEVAAGLVAADFEVNGTAITTAPTYVNGQWQITLTAAETASAERLSVKAAASGGTAFVPFGFVVLQSEIDNRGFLLSAVTAVTDAQSFTINHVATNINLVGRGVQVIQPDGDSEVGFIASHTAGAIVLNTGYSFTPEVGDAVIIHPAAADEAVDANVVSFPTDSIDADAIAASAVAEFQAGLATITETSGIAASLADGTDGLAAIRALVDAVKVVSDQFEFTGGDVHANTERVLGTQQIGTGVAGDNYRPTGAPPS